METAMKIEIVVRSLLYFAGAALLSASFTSCHAPTQAQARLNAPTEICPYARTP
jgi:hypothetical protein